MPIRKMHVSIGCFICLVLQRYLVLIAIEAARAAVEKHGRIFKGAIPHEDPLAYTKAAQQFIPGSVVDIEMRDILIGLMMPRPGALRHQLHPSTVLKLTGGSCKFCGNHGKP